MGKKRNGTINEKGGEGKGEAHNVQRKEWAWGGLMRVKMIMSLDGS